MKKLICLLFVMASIRAFELEPGVKLQPLVTYRCDDVVEPAFLRAFSQWNQALNNYFTLTKATDNDAPTLVITATVIDRPFLAYTYVFPQNASIAIQWPLRPWYQLADVDAIMLHEVGHALGLAHSTDASAIMWPTIPPLQPAVLGNDDIEGVIAIYQVASPLKVLVTGRGKQRTFRTSNKVDWDFGDGTKSRRPVARIVHRFPAKGQYQVTARSGLMVGWVIVTIK